MTQPIPVFDGHNDLLLHLHAQGDHRGESFLSGRPEGALDAAKCRAGGFAGGFFAIWVPGQGPDRLAPVDPDFARKATFDMAAILLRLTRAHPDVLRLVTDTAGISAARQDGAIAALMHLEGCEGIGPDLAELEVLHAAGLRSLGPVWSRPNIFGHGVPFAYPASPDIGPGLTDHGKRLLAECERLGILFDLSHLNEAGFWDVARLSSRPLVATHSNVHAISAQSRNLTDRQLAAIAETGGVVGLNYGCQFLRPDGQRRNDTDVGLMTRHLAYLVEHLGEGGVALGSDFDGALMPAAIGDAAGLPVLLRAMQDAGFGASLIQRICWQNWLDLLRRTIG